MHALVHTLLQMQLSMLTDHKSPMWPSLKEDQDRITTEMDIMYRVLFILTRFSILLATPRPYRVELESSSIECWHLESGTVAALGTVQLEKVDIHFLIVESPSALSGEHDGNCRYKNKTSGSFCDMKSNLNFRNIRMAFCIQTGTYYSFNLLTQMAALKVYPGLIWLRGA
jgi:hypothetical protein